MLKDGFYMPAEFDSHMGTIMIYPVRPGSWGKDRSKALSSFGDIFAEILIRENLYLLLTVEYEVEARNLINSKLSARGLTLDGLKGQLFIQHIDSDDSWARDVAPTFVRNNEGIVRGINWKFNAWGGEYDGLYANWDKDDKVAVSVCKNLGYEYYDADPFVLEGGSIHCDGEGTVMVTESCLLSKGRNPELTKAQIEDKLKRFLRAEKVLWLPRGIYNDETNEHVDNVCAFVAPGEVVLAWTDNQDDPQYELSLADYEYLISEKDAKGRSIKIHKLPIPDHPVLVGEEDLANYEFEEGEDNRDIGERLAASYVNYYYINGAVLVPQFGGDNEGSDKRAVQILESVCPGKEVIGISAGSILLGGGNIHCITQQIPVGNK